MPAGTTLKDLGSALIQPASQSAFSGVKTHAAPQRLLVGDPFARLRVMGLSKNRDFARGHPYSCETLVRHRWGWCELLCGGHRGSTPIFQTNPESHPSCCAERRFASRCGWYSTASGILCAMRTGGLCMSWISGTLFNVLGWTYTPYVVDWILMAPAEYYPC